MTISKVVRRLLFKTHLFEASFVSIIIHDENVENQGDEEVIAESDEDDDDTHIHDSILELYKNRHKSPEAFAQWQQLEQELFKKDAIKVEPIEENPVKTPIGN